MLLRPKVHAQVIHAAKLGDVPVSQFIAALVSEHFLSEAREKVG